MIYLVVSVCAITFIAVKVRENSKKIKRLQNKINNINEDMVEELDEK